MAFRKIRGRRSGKPREESGKAYAQALKLIAFKPRTVRELRERLERRGFTPARTGAVLARLAESGYLDDGKYARDWAEYAVREKRFGARRIARELQSRGIDRSSALAAAAGAFSSKTEEELAAEIIRDKIEREGCPVDGRGVARFVGYLIRRGFPGRMALEAVRNNMRQKET